MRSAFHHVALIHDKDEIRVAYGGQPVGYHEGRSALGELIHGALDERLGTGIDGACRLVEYYHGRVLHHGPRYRQELTLTRRKAAAVA